VGCCAGEFDGPIFGVCEGVGLNGGCCVGELEGLGSCEEVGVNIGERLEVGKVVGKTIGGGVGMEGFRVDVGLIKG
jgi:hypothetical protein